MKRLAVLVAVLAVTVPLRAGASASQPQPIDNPYFPLPLGAVFTFDGSQLGQPEHDVMTVTHRARTLDGIPRVEVDDIVQVGGKLVESTRDFYSQDAAGTVHYAGELALDFTVTPPSSAGSWLAGVGGARDGIIMLAHPDVGDCYLQERAAPVAEDAACVVPLASGPPLPGTLKTRESTKLEPGVHEFKSYALGLGNVAVAAPDEVLTLTSITLP